MTARLSIAVVGAGLIGRRHCDVIARSNACTLAAIVDPSNATRSFVEERGAPWFADLDAMFARIRPDGVILATPNRAHVAGAIACLDRGIPVLVEKPIADNVALARDLLAMERRRDVPVLVGHHRRHNPIVKAAKRILREGGIGRLLAVSSHWLLKKPDDYFDVGWRRETGGGPVLINLIHDIDNLRFICGDIAEIGAMVGHEGRGFAVEDTAVMNFRFAGGALGTAVLSDAAPAPWSWELASGENPAYPRREENCYIFAGTEGSLALPRMELWRYDGAPGWLEPLSRTIVETQSADPLVEQLRHFIAVIRGDETPLTSGVDAARTLAVIEAVRESAATGRNAVVADVAALEAA